MFSPRLNNSDVFVLVVDIKMLDYAGASIDMGQGGRVPPIFGRGALSRCPLNISRVIGTITVTS